MSPRIKRRLRARSRLRAAAAASATVAAASCVTLAVPAAAAARPAHYPSEPGAGSKAGHRAAPVPFSVTTRVRHKKGSKTFDPDITVRAGGARVGSADGPPPLNGVTFEAVGNGTDPTPHTCVTEENGPQGAGTCTITIDTTATQTYTVRPTSAAAAPGSWFINPSLGIYNGTNPSTTYGSAFRDVRSGQAGSFFSGTGYDLVTGIGAPISGASF